MLTSMTCKFSVDLANRSAGLESCTGNCVTKFCMFINVSVVIFFMRRGNARKSNNK